MTTVIGRVPSSEGPLAVQAEEQKVDFQGNGPRSGWSQGRRRSRLTSSWAVGSHMSELRGQFPDWAFVF